jgi:hypothetical protein
MPSRMMAKAPLVVSVANSQSPPRPEAATSFELVHQPRRMAGNRQPGISARRIVDVHVTENAGLAPTTAKLEDSCLPWRDS